jgi:hypothetical protein
MSTNDKMAKYLKVRRKQWRKEAFDWLVNPEFTENEIGNEFLRDMADLMLKRLAAIHTARQDSNLEPREAVKFARDTDQTTMAARYAVLLARMFPSADQSTIMAVVTEYTYRWFEFLAMLSIEQRTDLAHGAELTEKFLED